MVVETFTEVHKMRRYLLIYHNISFLPTLAVSYANYSRRIKLQLIMLKFPNYQLLLLQTFSFASFRSFEVELHLSALLRFISSVFMFFCVYGKKVLNIFRYDLQKTINMYLRLEIWVVWKEFLAHLYQTSLNTVFKTSFVPNNLLNFCGQEENPECILCVQKKQC